MNRMFVSKLIATFDSTLSSNQSYFQFKLGFENPFFRFDFNGAVFKVLALKYNRSIQD
ncbi:hypothetical protein [Leptospira kmetyi]|uniref:hypothetical protein n=1 Tax=Leptospira kmetyi TaxID=408139 RepID=UPI003EBFC21A